MSVKILLAMVFVVSMFGFAFAEPSIDIHSPINTTYNATQFLVNVTSNETVDFYISGIKDIYVERNSTSYTSYLYGRVGSYTYKIYAKNSNGVTSENVTYSTIQHNPVYLTTGGQITSPNTEYIFANNITDSIFWFFPTENISIDLNGFDLSDPESPIGTAHCSRSRIFNGTITTPGFVGIVLDFSASCLFENLTIKARDVDVQMDNIQKVTFNRVNFTGPIGLYFAGEPANVIVKNSWFIGDGNTPAISDTDAGLFHESSGPDTVLFEEVNFTNHSRDFVWQSVLIPEYITRNTHLTINGTDMSIIGNARIFKQHKIIINTTENNQTPVQTVVEIFDNSSIKRSESYDIIYNPTSSFLIATNSSGLAETWVTEKITILRTESPLTMEEVTFSPYLLTAKSRQDNVSVVLNAVGNSTFNVNFNIPPPSGGSLSACTIDQMLDLDNNGIVNSKDAKIILRHMVGHPVTINGTKNCNALNFFPV